MCAKFSLDFLPSAVPFKNLLLNKMSWEKALDYRSPLACGAHNQGFQAESQETSEVQCDRTFLDDNNLDLFVVSPGRATPRVSGILAQALGLPIEVVVDAIYRAPGRLVPSLPIQEARRLLAMLEPLDLDLALFPVGEPPPRGPVRDVAAELLDMDAADAVAEALGRFLGIAAPAAMDLLLTPPGIVLGNVTSPAVAALAACLPSGAVRLQEIEPEAARYALFAASLTAQQAGVLRRHSHAGAMFSADGGALLLGLSRGEADALWRRLHAPGKIKLVPEALLRFGIILQEAPPNAAPALQSLAGVPLDDYPILAEALPVQIESNLPLAYVEARLASYAKEGLVATAELESFSLVRLEILSASTAALAAVGLSGRLPLMTSPLPRPRAKLMRHRLEIAGAEVLEAAGG
jgi:hypothetical protein